MDPKEVIDNFVNIVTKKYFCFEGKAGRKEFWEFFLVCVVINLVLGFIPLTIIKVLSWLISLALLCPQLGVGARRLHDIGKSGWMQLIAFIPCIGILVLIYFWAQPSIAEAQAPADDAPQA